VRLMIYRSLSFLLLALFFAAAPVTIAQSKRMLFKQPMFAPHPDYPMPATGERPQGKGSYVVRIDSETGVVTSVSIKKSTGFAALDKAAIDTLRRWKFWTPSVSSAEIPIEFRH
ncbi:MAG TPA: energy transducer TonB, partial [Chthoniobacterales bacterium]